MNEMVRLDTIETSAARIAEGMYGRRSAKPHLGREEVRRHPGRPSVDVQGLERQQAEVR
jgi:hypothetical protein